VELQGRKDGKKIPSIRIMPYLSYFGKDMTCPGGASCASLEAFLHFIYPFIIGVGAVFAYQWLKPKTNVRLDDRREEE
jgi:hypothetical protein